MDSFCIKIHSIWADTPPLRIRRWLSQESSALLRRVALSVEIPTRCSTQHCTWLSFWRWKQLCWYGLSTCLTGSGIGGSVWCDAGDVFQVFSPFSVFPSVQEMSYFAQYTSRWEGYSCTWGLILERSTSSSIIVRRSLANTPSFWICARVVLGLAAFPTSGKTTFFQSTNWRTWESITWSPPTSSSQKTTSHRPVSSSFPPHPSKPLRRSHQNSRVFVARPLLRRRRSRVWMVVRCLRWCQTGVSVFVFSLFDVDDMTRIRTVRCPLTRVWNPIIVDRCRRRRFRWYFWSCVVS